MPRSPKSDNSGDELAGDDSLDSDENDKLKLAPDHASTSTSPKFGSASAQQGMAALQLFRSESNSKKVLGDPRLHKTQTLEVLTEMIAIDGTDPNAVPGFDPRRWIVAAGLLEKRRDGIMREGWAKRFFVLGKSTLYYFLLPKTDMSGHTPLLGDERGCIKLTDVQEVNAHARDSAYWYLNVTVAATVRKNNASQLFNSQVTQLQLRTPAETGQLWLDAITKARDDAKSSQSPSRGASYRKFSGTPTARDDSAYSNLAGHVSSADEQLPSIPKSSTPLAVVPELVRKNSTASRVRRDSLKSFRAMDLVPLEESFPLSKPVLLSPFLLSLLVLATLAFPKSLPLLAQQYVPQWLDFVPAYVFALQAVLVLAVYWSVSGRSSAHDRVVREARLRVGVMRDELNSIVKAEMVAEGCDVDIAMSEHILLPSTSSEIARAASNVALGLDGMHVAGSSTKFTAETMRPGVHFMCWSEAMGSNFKLRIGPNYKKNNLKAPSAEALYSIIGIDLLRSKDRICNVGASNRVELPCYRPDVDPPLEDIQRSGLPRLFIVNAQIPEKGPSLMSRGPDDSGYSLVFYFSVKSSTVAQAINEGDKAHPSIKLIKRYVKEHGSNPDIRRRFKAIGIADNAKDLNITMPGIKQLIDRFNGKPVIINKVAQIYESQEPLDWFEVDISIFDFPYTAQKALSAIKDRVSEIVLRAGFVVQGESDEELPECLLGGADMCGLDFRLAKVF